MNAHAARQRFVSREIAALKAALLECGVAGGLVESGRALSFLQEWGLSEELVPAAAASGSR